MTPSGPVTLLLLAAGTAALVLAALAVAVLPGTHARLHAGAPASLLGGPLIALALIVDTGPGRTALKIAVIALTLAAGGTVTTMALGHAAAQRDGVLPEEEPR